MNTTGMICDAEGRLVPGKILELWDSVRAAVGNIELKRKNGMKFDTRAATDLYDKVRAACNEYGVLVYPTEGRSKGTVVDNGTLADVEVTVIAQAIEDGSALQFYGYGQGADSQDKAGGKAGTYAFKQALIQALLAGGTGSGKSKKKAYGAEAPDTDDTDTPIEGGVKPKSNKPSAEAVKAAFEAAQDEPAYRAALADLKQLAPEHQVAMKPTAVAAKARCVKAA